MSEIDFRQHGLLTSALTVRLFRFFNELQAQWEHLNLPNSLNTARFLDRKYLGEMLNTMQFKFKADLNTYAHRSLADIPI